MLEKLNDKDLIKFYNLSTLIRYNHKIKIHNESVAEHSFFVSVFSIKIISQLKVLSEETKKNVLLLSILHDIGESKMSDIPYNVKLILKDFKKVIDNEEREFVKNELDFDIEKLESDELVYNIVKLADTYSVLQYCKIEKMLGNNNEEFIDIENVANENVKKYMLKIEKLIEEGKR